MTHKPRTRTRIDSVRVEIEFRGTPDIDPSHPGCMKKANALLDEWVKRVKGRLDDLPWFALVNSVVESTEVCVLCGLTPEPDGNGYPYCCDAAQAEFVAAKDGGGK